MPAGCPVCGTAVVRDEGAVRVYCPNVACPARVGPGVRALRRPRRHGHRGRRLGGPGAAPRARPGPARAATSSGCRRGPGVAGPVRPQERREPARPDRPSPRGRPLAPSSTALGIPQVGGADRDRPRDLAGRAWPAGRVPAGRPDGSPDRGSLPSQRSCGGSQRGAGRVSTDVHGIGPTVAAALARWFGGRRTRAASSTTSSRPASCRSGRPSARAAAAGPLAGMTMVVTGTLEGLAASRPRRRSAPPVASRADLSRGRPTTSWPASAAGSKLAKAQELGVPILDEAGFRAVAQRAGQWSSSRRIVMTDDGEQL